MAVLDRPNNLSFDADSIEFRNAVQDRLSELLRAMAVERAVGEQRTTITEADFRACLQTAVDQVVREMASK